MENRYYDQELDSVNKKDLLTWLFDEELVAIVDEEKGGIIGYVSRVHSNRIIKQLNTTAKKEEK